MENFWNITYWVLLSLSTSSNILHTFTPKLYSCYLCFWKKHLLGAGSFSGKYFYGTFDYTFMPPSSHWPWFSFSVWLSLDTPQCIPNMIKIGGHLFSPLPNQWQHQDWARRLEPSIIFINYSESYGVNKSYIWTQYSYKVIGTSNRIFQYPPYYWIAILNPYLSFCCPLLCFLVGFDDIWDSLGLTL